MSAPKAPLRIILNEARQAKLKELPAPVHISAPGLDADGGAPRQSRPQRRGLILLMEIHPKGTSSLWSGRLGCAALGVTWGCELSARAGDPSTGSLRDAAQDDHGGGRATARRAGSPGVRAGVGVLDMAAGGERVEQARDVSPTGAVDGAAWIEGKAMARLRGLQKLLGTGDKPACLFDPRTHLVRIRCKQLIIALLPAVLHDRREACIEMTPISLHTSDVAGN